ncbi:hypothetical protein [Paenibacillus ginsengihumi]|uniref:hypothetical protein n=1 Tax=Paenibacillus ginsengihumi TaxID=431596 RepID=UPI00037A21E3|nr:hypothetical protein [Paenibacillus ginsengihumi]
MVRRFVIEAIMIATYGQMLMPSRPVEYIIPYSTILELYDMRESQDPIMTSPEDEAHVRGKLNELIAFFEDSFNKKKIEKSLVAPWRPSSPLLVNEKVSLTVIHAVDNAQYGELFDPIETELILTAMKEQAPLLTDQFELQDKLIEHGVPIQIYDVDDFDFAVEEGISPEDLQTT